MTPAELRRFAALMEMFRTVCKIEQDVSDGRDEDPRQVTARLRAAITLTRLELHRDE